METRDAPARRKWPQRASLLLLALIILWIAFRWAQPAHDPVYQVKRPLPTDQPSATLPAMSETSFDIHYVARLARLELSAAEEQKLGGQLRQVLDYIEQLKRVDISNVEPTAHAIPLANVMLRVAECLRK